MRVAGDDGIYDTNSLNRKGIEKFQWKLVDLILANEYRPLEPLLEN